MNTADKLSRREALAVAVGTFFASALSISPVAQSSAALLGLITDLDFDRPFAHPELNKIFGHEDLRREVARSCPTLARLAAMRLVSLGVPGEDARQAVCSVWWHCREAAPGTFARTVMQLDPRIILAHDPNCCERTELAASRICGCYYCGAIFPPGDICEWVRERNGQETGCCPKCGIDSVLGSASGYPVTGDFLTRMQEFWFG